MEHQFNTEFAKKYGIEEAIIIHNFYFWLRKNLANEKHLYDGRVWTYNSNNAFVELFPYINKTKIFRVLKNLDEQGIILKGNFNSSVWDKTLWYAFSDNGIDEISACGYDVTEFRKMNHREKQSETTIPYSKHTDSITDNKEKEDNKLSSQKKFNFKQGLLDLGVCESVVNDFLLVRKNKKATNSETAFNRIKSEIAKSGLSANDCITIAVENSWQGFKAEWLHKTKSQNITTFFKTYTPRNISDSAKDYLHTLKVGVKFERDGTKYLVDDTYVIGGKRYYRDKRGNAVEVPMGLEERPNESYEYNRNMASWVQDEQRKTLNDMLF